MNETYLEGSEVMTHEVPTNGFRPVVRRREPDTRFLDPTVDPSNPPVDEEGNPIEADSFLVARSTTDLLKILEWGNEQMGVEVAVRGPGTSSGSYKKPPEVWQAAQGKGRFALVRLEGGEFDQVVLNSDEAVVGPNVSVGDARSLVEQMTKGRKEIGINITIPTPSMGGTLWGATGVSDSARSALTEMTGGRLILPNGRVVEPDFAPHTYFDHTRLQSTEARLEDLIARFPHRRAPFGYGLEGRLRLHDAPDQKMRVFYPFTRRPGETMEALEGRFLAAIHHLNVRIESLFSQDPNADFSQGIQVRACELMDRAALNLAREGIGWTPFTQDENAELALMVEYGSLGLDEENFCQALFDQDLFLEGDNHADGSATISDRGEKRFHLAETFRAKAPEAMRSVTKAHPTWYKGTTDFGVRASNETLMMHLGQSTLARRRVAIERGVPQALYGHGLLRFGPHLREATGDQVYWTERNQEVDILARWVLSRQLAGEDALLYMEKPVKPVGPETDLMLQGVRSVPGLIQANRRFFKEIDPNGLRHSTQLERWAS